MNLKTKLVRTMVATLALIASAVLVAVTTLHIWSARGTAALVESKIEESIARKGIGLCTNQAQALTSLVDDNAFGDVRRLVTGSLHDDPEIVYGLFVGADLQAWAYASPDRPAAGADGPSPHAWLELDLPRQRLNPPAPWTERRQVFGRDVFEFGAPVRRGDGEVMGTIVYGLSGVPLAAALATARGESRRSLAVTLGLVVVLTVGTALVGLLLVRRAAARITQPLSQLTQAATAIAANQRDKRVAIHSGDELETLGNAFNQMVGELQQSYASLEAMNRTLEQRVQERTQELAGRNRDMRLVLDTVNEGLLTISKDGWLAEERSAQIDRWFGPFTTPLRLHDFLARIDPVFADFFDVSHQQLLDDFLPLPVVLSQMPARLRSAGRTFDVSYLPIAANTVAQGLLVAITDVTEQIALQKQEAEQREVLAALQGMTQDRAGFLTFFDEANRIVTGLEAGGDDGGARKRMLHTLKGNAASAGFHLIAELADKAEDEIAEMEANANANAPAGPGSTGAGAGAAAAAPPPSLVALAERWAALGRTIAQLVGEHGRKTIEISVEEIDRLRDALDKDGAPSRIRDQLIRWRLEPAARPLQRLGERGRLLAARLGKGDLTVIVDGGSLRLDPARWGPLWAELIHVVRNAVDHGIEAPADRRAAGKLAPPELRLSATLRGPDLCLEIADNGRGIDWAAVRAAAEQRGLPARTEAELTAALLAGGLSGRPTVSETSGRGVGMDAVATRVREAGGSISVASRAGLGTTWRFAFPRAGLSPFEGFDPLLGPRRADGHAAA